MARKHSARPLGNWARGQIVDLRMELSEMKGEIGQAARINAKEHGPLLVQFLLGESRARLERLDADIGRLLDYKG